MRSLSPMQLQEDVLERELLDLDLGFGAETALPDVAVQIRRSQPCTTAVAVLLARARSAQARSESSSEAGSGRASRARARRTIDSIEGIEVAVPVAVRWSLTNPDLVREPLDVGHDVRREHDGALGRRPSTSMICSRNWRRAIGSRLATGSSRIRTIGTCARARAGSTASAVGRRTCP